MEARAHTEVTTARLPSRSTQTTEPTIGTIPTAGPGTFLNLPPTAHRTELGPTPIPGYQTTAPSQ